MMLPQTTSIDGKTNQRHASNQEFPAVDLEGLLRSLNPAQLRAVEHDPSIPLQILAGPGSGKTKVLTSRIAYLILVHEVSPSSICAVTFTNKAANEMRERLTKLIGKKRTTALQMGTFHSICVRYLRMHSSVVGLEDNFTICDAEESKKLVLALLKPYSEYIKKADIPITETNVLSWISRAKAKGQSAAEFLKEMEEKERSKRRLLRLGDIPNDHKSMERIIAEIYIGYERVLQNNKALDFDDLLVYGVKLFSTHEEAVLWCRHVLVDEFQDTNTIQYELMKCIGIRGRVTIVGDPDQSIYGWRSAEVGNLSKMCKDFPGTQQIFLEQNYRSTSSILRCSLAVVAEDSKRIPKSLHTANPLGSTPFLGDFDNEKDESDFIASEIKRCSANMGGVYKWGDFAILLRFNALSRPIESALQKQGIPCRILGGHKFFERMEVKDILSYLQLVDNPDFNPAFIRAVKVPPRGAGDKSLGEITSKAEQLKIPQLGLVEKIVNNKIPDIKPSIKKKLSPFMNVINALRSLNEEKIPPSEMIRKLTKMINYEDYLKKTQQDWESRWENIQELITFASEVEADKFSKEQQQSQDNAMSQQSGVECTLRHFLQSSMLSTEGDNDTEEKSKEKVTISTCHAAKGLEWPVVIIPSVDQNTFPFYRTEDVDEERRLLYVACTRAQSLLYLLYSRKRQVAGKAKEKSLSDFVSVPLKKSGGLFSSDVPRFLPADRAVICAVLGRDLPDEAEIDRRLKELELSGDFVRPKHQTPLGQMATVDLTGVKSAVHDVPVHSTSEHISALYAAPDALAAISSAFMKDYNPSVPFSKSSRHLPRAAPSPFMPVSVALQSASFQLNTMLHGGASVPGFGAEARPSNAFSSIPVSPLMIHQNHESIPQISRDAQRQPYETQIVVQQRALTSRSVIQTPTHDLPSYLLPRTEQTSDRNIHEVTSSTSHYDQNNPPGESSFRAKSSSSGLKTASNSTPGKMATLSRSPMVTSSPEETCHTNSLMVDVPSVQIRSQTQPILKPATSPLATGPPTVGVKRRLGMGRYVTGYSNKKFKSHV